MTGFIIGLVLGGVGGFVACWRYKDAIVKYFDGFR